MAFHPAPSTGGMAGRDPPVTQAQTELNERQFRLANSHKEFVIVCKYTDLDCLAHMPQGTPARRGLSVFMLDDDTGRLTLCAYHDEIQNPAFVRTHPTKNIFYVVTESIRENGFIYACSLCPLTGEVTVLSKTSTEGRSACYITLSADLRYALVTNYWDSNLVAVPVRPNGDLEPEKSVVSRIPGEHVKNEREAHGDEPHSAHRLKESHAHAAVFDPATGRRCYVPDLGEGTIKEFGFDLKSGEMTFRNTVSLGRQSGPRYIEFHPNLPVCYVVNELASTVVVFKFAQEKVEYREAQRNNDAKPETLQPIQEISTIPLAFPKDCNTCGRIATDRTGRFVLVSNRGHDSISVYRVSNGHDGVPGHLVNVGYYHTSGFTPRHFKFSSSGKWLFAANQDSDSIAVFRFNTLTGELKHTRTYASMSPNFVAIMQPTMVSRETDPNRFNNAAKL